MSKQKKSTTSIIWSCIYLVLGIVLFFLGIEMLISSQPIIRFSKIHMLPIVKSGIMQLISGCLFFILGFNGLTRNGNKKEEIEPRKRKFVSIVKNYKKQFKK